ncbi:MAG: hypothetical protein KMY55_14640 [Dethiosulfatibacter sp.]|nr:hypothetical protein [Dethiosulfatibacter sp.]
MELRLESLLSPNPSEPLPLQRFRRVQLYNPLYSTVTKSRVLSPNLEERR